MGESIVFAEFLQETSKALMEEYNSKIDVEPVAAEYTDGIKQLRYTLLLYLEPNR